MWPTLYEIQTAAQPIGVHTYGLMILAAFCGAFILVHLRAQRIGLHPDRVIPLYVAAAVGGLLGGRILYALAVGSAEASARAGSTLELLWILISDPSWLFSSGGFAVYGGIIGGTLAVGATSHFLGILPWKLADIAAPAVLLGMGIGRFGCFFAGCCHGAEVPHFEPTMGLLPESFRGGQIWLSDEFPYMATEFASGNGGVSRLTDVPLYPTQLWAAFVLLALAAYLSWVWERRRFDGQIAALALILEPFYRITVEAFRADHRGYAFSWPVSEGLASWLPSGMTQAGASLGDGHMMGITTSQAIGIGSLLFGVAIFVLRRNAGVAEETPVSSGEEDFDDVPDAIL
ncbi:MAG: prolipoprotein diacylglyceryl transferase [Myxococcales bacterium]|nr:prolipoprotein diacylglyceryl transferase [Myxococcales bacterium]MCB9669001.1 prolipoprotein diacylglyceryl transferase [Alphaproteobacteria bacterium]MCB9691328.1 prolipoprotein diacylglyceryl transferase [Alphaproteobacteria bacterium]